jgi:hypothetical protein
MHSLHQMRMMAAMIVASSAMARIDDPSQQQPYRHRHFGAKHFRQHYEPLAVRRERRKMERQNKKKGRKR